LKKTIKILLLFLPGFLLSQTVEERLALQAFTNREYDKAVVYYEKLYDKNPTEHYPNYFKCLLQTKEYKRAEKIAKKQLKANADFLVAYVDLAMVYIADGNDVKKAEDQFSKAIREMHDPSQVYDLAQRLTELRQFDFAIQAFEKAGKINGDPYPFKYEIAEIYQQKGDIKAMVNQYLDILDARGETELFIVQSRLTSSLGYDEDQGGLNHPVLKAELLRKIQSNADKTVFAELLVWIQLQQKDYEGAFIQSKALDKRKKEGGQRLMELGIASATDENYEVAQRCFDYVIEKGLPEFYDQATVESVNVLYEKITRSGNYTKQDLIDLETRLTSTLKKIRVANVAFPVIKKLAHLQAYYMSKDTAAVRLLQETIDANAISRSMQAELKLELGDILLLRGEIWEASLLYSQVDKLFKHEPIGQEAKFRNAKISYYTGDFKWSKAQLDILKGATSKLIANDAMDLSLVISDAIGIDTNAVPLEWFASAELLVRQNKFQQAVARMDSINLIFSDHSLADDILMQKAKIAVRGGKFQEAADYYGKVVSEFGDEIFGDDALFFLAQLNETQLKNPEKAKQLYEEIMLNYSGSVYTTEARKRYRKLRGDKLN
jgi:tetratricopeptide (TPR) repeat protein